MATAKRIESFKDKYFTVSVYEYRGRKYEVKYANDWTCCTTPAHIQHRDAQAEIDEAFDNPKKEAEGKAFDANEIWEAYGW